MTLQPGFFSRNRLIPSALTEVPRTHTRPGLSPQEREGPRRSHPGSEKEIACGVQAFRKYAAAIRPLALCRPGLSQFQSCRCRPGSARCIGKPLQHVPRVSRRTLLGPEDPRAAPEQKAGHLLLSISPMPIRHFFEASFHLIETFSPIFGCRIAWHKLTDVDRRDEFTHIVQIVLDQASKEVSIER